MIDGLSAVLLLIALAAAGWILFSTKGEYGDDQVSSMRAAAELSFKRLSVDCADPAFSIDGRTAEMVKVDDQVFSVEGVPIRLSLHIYARNPHGEYFYVIAKNEDKPFVKHITHAAAKVVLKDKYVAASA